MKKRWIFSFFLCFASAVFFLFFCFFGQPPGQDLCATYYENRFTFVSPIANAGYWGSAAYGMKKADQLQNSNTKFIGLTLHAKRGMAQAIASAVHSRPDGLITVGSHDADVIASLRAASDADIPIVLIDTDSSEVERLCYIGTDNYEAGRLAGRDMTDSVSEPLFIAAIVSSASMENQIERLRGFKDEIALHPDCSLETVLETNSSLLLLNELVPRALKENPKINAIFCAEGYSSSLVGKILSDMGLAYDHIRVVAFDQMEDTLQYVKSGQYFSTIVQQSDQMGEIAVSILNDYQKGILPKDDIIHTSSYSIRKDNFNAVQKYESEGVTWHIYSGDILSTPQRES